MTEIQQNRYDQLIRRVNNIVSGGSMVGDALNELFPMIDVENVPGELLAIMGTDLGIGASSLTGAAGETAKIQLFNPVGSRQLITCTKIVYSSSVATTSRIAINNTALTTAVSTQIFRDRRKLLTARPVGTIRQVSSVPLTDAHMLIQLVAATPFVLEDVNGICVLNPGSGIEVSNGTPASGMTVTFFWRERVGEPSEFGL